VDQFQVMVGGNGMLGKHPVPPCTVHFSRAYTPYGPIRSDGKSAVAFFTLRAHYDPGSNYLPDTRDTLRQVKGRDPFQISVHAEFPSLDSARAAGGSRMVELPGMKNDRGLLGAAISLAPDASTVAPDPVSGDGQYLLITKGGLLHEGRECKAYTIVFVEPHEGAFRLTAGSEGLEALILNLPRVGERTSPVPAVVRGLKIWQCEFCSFVYDEAAGMPEEGVAPGTRWEDVPESWSCPDCSATKADFKMAEV
jgi:rubredoxin